MKNSLYILPIIILLYACGSETKQQVTETPMAEVNPAAENFDHEGSDAKAIIIADMVMSAMGGRDNWDNTKVIRWTFFGRRTHTWDKWSGRNQIEIPSEEMVIDLNINTGEGDVWTAGVKMTNPDSLAKYLKRGKSMWINDAYWLVMPYKLKDSGVTLKYVGEETDEDNNTCEVLELTFKNVGDTPDNKYLVYVNKQDSLVCKWAYFPNQELEEPSITTPWKNYQKHGNILLSGDRGRGSLTDIAVLETWPED